jgi:CBS domain-containing protein
MSHFKPCTPDTSLARAATLMRDSGAGALLVVSRDGKIAGTVTERDLVRRGLAGGLALDTPVEEVLNRDVVTLGIDYRLSQVLEQLPRTEIDRIVIVDEKKRPIGLFCQADLYRLFALELSQLAERSDRFNHEAVPRGRAA